MEGYVLTMDGCLRLNDVLQKKMASDLPGEVVDVLDSLMGSDVKGKLKVLAVQSCPGQDVDS